jgi:hypothetical protein
MGLEKGSDADEGRKDEEAQDGGAWTNEYERAARTRRSERQGAGKGRVGGITRPEQRAWQRRADGKGQVREGAPRLGVVDDTVRVRSCFFCKEFALGGWCAAVEYRRVPELRGDRVEPRLDDKADGTEEREGEAAWDSREQRAIKVEERERERKREKGKTRRRGGDEDGSVASEEID